MDRPGYDARCCTRGMYIFAFKCFNIPSLSRKGYRGKTKMKTLGVRIHERYSLFERFLRSVMRLFAFGFLAIVDIRFVPLIVICIALHVISRRDQID